MGRLGGTAEHRGGEGFPRRSFVRRAGLLGAALATLDVAALLESRGLLPAAQAQTLDLTTDTLSGLIAFIAPGDDPYSIAQGERASGPGGIGAGAVQALIDGLDHFVPANVLGPGSTTLPASGGVATLLNHYAERVNPAATGGGFASPFARLSFADKAKVFELFESEPAADGTELRFVAGILPGFSAFLAFSEVGVLDRATRKLTGRAVGWDIARYSGPAEGHAELRGYWHGHRSALKPRRRRKKAR
ncbi:MAG: hypothetical protein QOF37_2179 [Thermoleophilaceae bacterium]|nr:hypothetical protein [Thermoleophilaceae bacterium]